MVMGSVFDGMVNSYIVPILLYTLTLVLKIYIYKNKLISCTISFGVNQLLSSTQIIRTKTFSDECLSFSIG